MPVELDESNLEVRGHCDSCVHPGIRKLNLAGDKYLCNECYRYLVERQKEIFFYLLDAWERYCGKRPKEIGIPYSIQESAVNMILANKALSDKIIQIQSNRAENRSIDIDIFFARHPGANKDTLDWKQFGHPVIRNKTYRQVIEILYPIWGSYC